MTPEFLLSQSSLRKQMAWSVSCCSYAWTY